jgi:hypothetical protein
MFWDLLLAHFLGDFVLQTDWMVKHRDNLWVLSLHASIHFVLMFLLAGQARSIIWPYLMLIAILHFIQDRVKNNITNKRKDWIEPGFILDQILHFVTIWAVVEWLQEGLGFTFPPQKPVGAIIGIAYLLVTYVWFIVERIFNFSNTEYLQNINNTKFSRMISRGGLISVFLLVWQRAIAGLAFIFPNPYPQSKFRKRAMLTDFSVSLFAMIFLFWALR